jgi:hypothetical protein
MYRETREHGFNFVEPPPDIIKGEPEWEVEAIIGMRLFGRRKQKQYCVRWRGYADAYDTWEPEENIHALRLIEQYLQSQQMIIRATRQGSRTNLSNIPIPHLALITPPRSPSDQEPPFDAQPAEKKPKELPRMTQDHPAMNPWWEPKPRTIKITATATLKEN